MKLYLNKKTITACAAIFMTVLVITSCKEYLDVPPQGELTDDEIRTNPNAASDLVNGVYNSLWQGESFGGPDVHGLSFAFVSNVASDDADKGSNPDDYSAAKDVDNFTLSVNNQIMNGLWRGHYQ